MRHSPALKHQLQVGHHFAVRFLGILVALHGLFIISITLLAQIGLHRNSHVSSFVIDLPLAVGLSLIYLASQLQRRKRSAWLVTVLAYTFYVGFSIANFAFHEEIHGTDDHDLTRVIILPIVVLALLLIFERQFIVKSDIQGFRNAVGFTLIMLMLTLVYGTSGFLLLDNSDFHQEIRPATALHYTIDQFDLTTNKPLHPHTRRAYLFTDSLSVISTGAIIYAIVALFQPLRGRIVSQDATRQQIHQLLEQYGGRSEDFFKLWPHDKQYFFSDDGQAALAFHVSQGVALCIGDPVGNQQRYYQLLSSFVALCFSNGWLAAVIHAEATNKQLYEQHNFNLQKIGQEAILDLDHFQKNVKADKYFRQIGNRFGKHGFSCELLIPPHHQAVIDRLKTISDQWLARDGHAERGFAMGYFSTEYMQQCRLMVARDAAGTIQAFLNQLPADFDNQEANFDLLRTADTSPSNTSDYLLMGCIEQLHQEDYKRLNMGLCALTGLDETDAERKRLIDGVLKFAYAAGGRFYSFNGLYRFKSKYQPEWRDRYIVYQDGLRGFSRTTTALMRAMRVK